MINRKTAAAGLLSVMLMGTTAFAGPATFHNTEPKNWDFPAKGKLEASMSENGIHITAAHAEWSSKQIDLFRHADYVRFPALSFRTDSAEELQPKVMITNLPGAKFEIGPANDSDLSGIEITVFSLAASKMVEDKPYEFYTAWMQPGKISPDVTLHSLQRYGGQTGGMYRDMPDTDDILAKSKWNEADVSTKWERTSSLQDDSLKFSSNVAVPEPATYKKIKSDYSYIHSKKALEQYKKEADKKLEDSFQQAYPHFAITFAHPVSLEHLEKMLSEYVGIEVSQVYAVGTTSDNREYTMSWFHTDPKLLSSLSSDMKIKSFGITELEGRASEYNVKKLRSETFVGTIEVEEQNRRPTGIHWLNKLYSGSEFKK